MDPDFVIRRSLSGTIRLLLDTEAGRLYRLDYTTCGRTDPGGADSHGSVIDVLVDGQVAHTAVAGTARVPRDVYFTASASRTELAFVSVDRHPTGLDSVTVRPLESIDRAAARARFEEFLQRPCPPLAETTDPGNLIHSASA